VENKRFELLTEACKATAFPITPIPQNLVPSKGIEPLHPDYKTGPLPLRIRGLNLAVLGGNDPHSYGVTSRRASMNTLRPFMECVTGVEPACNGFAIRGLTVQLHTHITILKHIPYLRLLSCNYADFSSQIVRPRI
jgi:hypothetical protein